MAKGATAEKDATRLAFTAKDIRPYGDRVLLRKIENEVSKGGIILPGGEKTECAYAEVLACGPGARCLEDGRILPMRVKPGQKVLTMKYAGCEVVVEGETEKLRMVAEGDIWAIVEGEIRG